ncbi:hypothetical protein LSPH24S_00236 [Lysinibacillus sphaericus]
MKEGIVYLVGAGQEILSSLQYMGWNVFKRPMSLHTIV